MSRGVRARVAAPEGGAAGGAGSTDPLRECCCEFVVDVHPARTLNAQEAVRDELNSKLMRCVPRARGCGRGHGCASSGGHGHGCFCAAG